MMNIANIGASLQNNKLMNSFAKQRELLIVASVVFVIILMVIPLPTAFMDLFLAANIALALMILLISMYNRRPLDFSVFPALLLAVTMFRLSLNVATTRLILSRGYAGEVINVFGNFVTGGNMIVGFIIFVIIVLINFLVITKGAGRIAEVAARFTLDAMPGKQMAIDADLNAGLITEDIAKQRRTDVSREADFYGAMDGASKFVKGDAIAGILITIIDIIGGFIIGMTQMGLTFEASLVKFTTLTIGDGLVSQMPALMISVGTGILVSRAGSEDSLGGEIASQLFSNFRALFVAGATMFFLGFIPGLPTHLFVFIALFLGGIGFMVWHSNKVREQEEQIVAKAGTMKKNLAADAEEKVEDYLIVDPLEIEIGYALIMLVDVSQGGDLLDRIKQIRNQLASQLGIVIPPVRIRDNMQLEPNQYVIKIRTVKVASGELMSGSYLAMNPTGNLEAIRGIQTIEPAFGLPAVWITESQKDFAEMSGYTVVELPAVLATHLTEVIKNNAEDLLTRQDTQELINNIKDSHKAVVDEVIPSILSLGEVHKVLQNLVHEQVSIRDLPRILEILGEVGRQNKNIDVLTEYTRNGLSAQICERIKNADNTIRVITLDPNLEAKLEGSLTEYDGTVKLNLSPSDAGAIIDTVKKTAQDVKQIGEMPIMVTSPVIRLQMKRLTESDIPGMTVLSYNEIVSGIELQSIGMVSLDKDNDDETTQ
ncbi:MAG: flagellar biosynthesis protein FlhA [Chitinispirillales bacterium]|jgi:flagellar biosynthesis protein FlhA|nr:flagellar biosynthesis protein FlhA [Chitinispirillales bacterium]